MTETLRGEIVSVLEEPDGRLFLTVKPENAEGMVTLHLRVPSGVRIPGVGDQVEYDVPK